MKPVSTRTAGTIVIPKHFCQLKLNASTAHQVSSSPTPAGLIILISCRTTARPMRLPYYCYSSLLSAVGLQAAQPAAPAPLRSCPRCCFASIACVLKSFEGQAVFFSSDSFFASKEQRTQPAKTTEVLSLVDSLPVSLGASQRLLLMIRNPRTTAAPRVWAVGLTADCSLRP